MASREVSSSASPGVLVNRPLPPTFRSVQDVLNKQGVAMGSFVSVVGVVRDVRLPIQTKNGGSNYIPVDQQEQRNPR